MTSRLVRLGLLIATIAIISWGVTRGFIPLAIVRYVLTSPSYKPVFHVGPVEFQVANRFLEVPWPTGEVPGEPASGCAHSEEFRRRNAFTCSGISPNVFMIVPLRLRRADGHIVVWDSGVVVQYMDDTQYPAYSFDALSHPASIRYYPADAVAFARSPRLQGLRGQSQRGHLAKTERSKGLCTSDRGRRQDRAHRRRRTSVRLVRALTQQQRSRGIRLSGINGFLTDSYPKRPDMTYPYSIKFSFPGWAAAESHETGLSIVAYVSRFIISHGCATAATRRLAGS